MGGEGLDGLVGAATLRPFGLAVAGELGGEIFVVHLGEGAEGISDELEPRVGAVGREAGGGFEAVAGGEARADFPLGEGQVAGRFQIIVAAHHELGPAHAGEGVAQEEGGREALGGGLAEGAGEPRAEVTGKGLGREGLGVPREVERQLGEILGGLDVADVEDPHAADAAGVGLAELLGKERGRGGRQPKVVVRGAPVREVIIEAVAAGAGALGLGGQVRQVTVVVVAPHQRDVGGTSSPAR